MLNISSVKTLHNGINMPYFGLGTYQMGGSELIKALDTSLREGYRLIDTAAVYRNEEVIGEYLSKVFAGQVEGLNLKRSDIFITTKLAPKDQGYDEAYAACKLSLQALKLEYVDLYLIHWPGKQRLQPDDPRNAEARRGSWLALERLYQEGKAKSIGVSNYLVLHLKEVEGYAKILPMVVQNECHPLKLSKEEREYCQEKGIAFQAYTSLGRGQFFKKENAEDRDKEVPEEVITNIARIAQTHKVHVAQVLLRWALQHGILVIPKSATSKYIQLNAKIYDFTLSKEEMDEIDDFGIKTVHPFCWDPSHIV